MKNINKKLMKIKLSITTIKRKQEHDLDLRTKIAK
jgi:hypothetical protein